MLSDSSYVSESSDSDENPLFTPAIKDQPLEKPFIPTEEDEKQRGMLSYKTIDTIIKQREAFLKRQREEIQRVWGENYNPFPALDKIANRIALGQVRVVSDLLEKTCDSFIDSLVQSEFFPQEN